MGNNKKRTGWFPLFIDGEGLKPQETGYRKSKYSKYWRVLSREWNASQIDIYGLICFQSIFKLVVLIYDLLICCDWSPLLQNDCFCVRIRNKETFMGFIAKKVHIIILIMKLFIGFDNMYIYSMHFWCVYVWFFNIWYFYIAIYCTLSMLSPCQLY